MLLITYNPDTKPRREPWNKDKLVGPKPPFKLQEIWTIRTRLQLDQRIRDLVRSTPFLGGSLMRPLRG